ncbi:MAG: cyclomaltodextrinase [Butyrivibrio sp.]|nr:cyclomaltodextrinase [Butyrivibrio sp.]
MWAYETSFYQIYPLGFCGAPFENDGKLQHRILKVIDWIPHFKKLGIGAVMFNPVFESDTHGYNTRDYKKIDVRLGTNKDFKEVCDALHKEGIRVVLDGVFNHAGRGFFGFTDVLEKRWDSPYKDWFNISFEGNSNYNDGLWYEGWEGNYDLVKLNLKNPAVADYLMESAKFWVDEFGIDGLRLDVAYCLDPDFIRRLRRESASWKEDFFLMGEMIGGDYNRIMGDDLCHSATNYECYKGMFSALNSMNLFEIIHSLLRQFGPENWTLYRGRHLLSFVDNHDVSRIASILQRPEHLKLIYTIMFGMPGIPTIYYGSEWGAKADKSQGDPALRPCFEAPEWNELTDVIASLCKAKEGSKALAYGDFKSLLLTNRQCIFERETDGDRALIVINADENQFHADFNARAGKATDAVTGQEIDFGGGLDITGYTAYLLQDLK